MKRAQRPVRENVRPSLAERDIPIVVLACIDYLALSATPGIRRAVGNRANRRLFGDCLPLRLGIRLPGNNLDLRFDDIGAEQASVLVVRKVIYATRIVARTIGVVVERPRRVGTVPRPQIVNIVAFNLTKR